MIDTWLSLPLPVMFLAVAGFFSASAACLYWLCFGGLTRRWMLSFSGAVAELFSAIMVIFGIQIGFVANDVWDRNRRASAAVEAESASLAMRRLHPPKLQTSHGFCCSRARFPERSGGHFLAAPALAHRHG